MGVNPRFMKNKLFILICCILANSSFSQAEQVCSGGPFEVVKPFLGRWQEFNVINHKEEFIGTLESTLEQDGCVISQRFVSKDASFSYMSFGYVDPASNSWQETYVFNNGSISKYLWQLDDEDVVTKRIGGTRKLDYMQQLRLTAITENQYDVIEEHSFDGGKTWKNVELTRIKRVQ